MDQDLDVLIGESRLEACLDAGPAAPVLEQGEDLGDLVVAGMAEELVAQVAALSTSMRVYGRMIRSASKYTKSGYVSLARPARRAPSISTTRERKSKSSPRLGGQSMTNGPVARGALLAPA